MKSKAKKPQPADDNINNNPDRAETVKELVKRHLKDETHITTEEELRNATLDLPEITAAQSAEIGDLVRDEPPAPEDKENDDLEIKKPAPNPLDVLS